MLTLFGVDVSSEVVVENIVERVTDSVEANLALPSQRMPPTWVADGAMALGVDLEGEQEDSTFTFSSPPATTMDDVVH